MKKKLKYYALQDKDGHLATTIDGKVLVTTHSLNLRGRDMGMYRCVEMIVKGKSSA